MRSYSPNLLVFIAFSPPSSTCLLFPHLPSTTSLSPSLSLHFQRPLPLLVPLSFNVHLQSLLPSSTFPTPPPPASSYPSPPCPSRPPVRPPARPPSPPRLGSGPRCCCATRRCKWRGERRESAEWDPQVHVTHLIRTRPKDVEREGETERDAARERDREGRRKGIDLERGRG